MGSSASTFIVRSSGTLSSSDLKALEGTGGTVLVDGVVTLEGGEVPPGGGRPVVSLPHGVFLVFTLSGSLDLGTRDLVVHSAVEAGDHPVFRAATDGTRVRFADDCIRREVRVAWWGAASSGDGASNRGAIEAAIGSVLPTGAAGPASGRVVLPPGTIRLDRGIALPTGIALQGSSSGRTLLSTVAGGTGGPGTLVYATGTDGCCRIRDVGLAGPGTLPAGFSLALWRGLVVAPGVAVDLRNVSFEGFEEGVVAETAPRLFAERCSFGGNRCGMVLDACSDAIIQSCTFSMAGSGWVGVRVGRNSGTARCVNVSFPGCTFRGSAADHGQTGIDVSSARNLRIADCRFLLLGTGTRFAADSLEGMGASLEGCRFERCAARVVSS